MQINELSRRDFTQQTLGSLLTFSLLESLFSGEVLADEIKPTAAAWLKRVNELSRDVRGKKLTQIEWQQQIETLYNKIELPELLRFINFDKLTANLEFRDSGERSLQARFPQVEGLPTSLVFGHQIFALKKGRSVAPHGHDNMATAFLILNGSFHGRHYERLENEPKFMIIKPTIDRQFGVGEYSSISDDKDNVHWFQATSDTAFIFNIHVMGITPGRLHGRVFVDPNGEKLTGGRIRAKRISSTEAYKLYG